MSREGRFFHGQNRRNVLVFVEQQFVTLLGRVIRETQQLWPFAINSIVLLPDHLHAIWSLASEDMDCPKRWGWLKKEFTKRYLQAGGTRTNSFAITAMVSTKRCLATTILEHTFEDEDDYETHFDDIHWNPVKHKYVSCPVAWAQTSFHRRVEQGVYKMNWGCDRREPLAIRKSMKDFGE